MAFLERITYESRLIAGGVIVVIALIVFPVFLARGPELPTSLTDRTIFVSQAFVNRDQRKLAAISASGMTRASERWLAKLRPSYWGPQVEGSPIEVEVEVMFLNAKAGRACVVATVTIPALASPESLSRKSVFAPAGGP